MILGLKQTFLIDGKEQEAVKINQTKGNYEINGTKKWNRIPLTQDHLKSLEESGIEWKSAEGIAPYWSSRVFGTGKYMIKYNNKQYYITYLDDLELFFQTVLA